MRYLLALLLMIVVGWDAVAQTPVPPEVRFKESGPTMVTEGVHTTVETDIPTNCFSFIKLETGDRFS